MTRPKGSPNKAYKAKHINIVSIKVSNELFAWLKEQPNRANYLRSLIEKDMNERKPKEQDEFTMNGRYYVSTTDQHGNFDGLLNNQSKGIHVADLEEAMSIYKSEIQYLESSYELSDNDGEGYYCSIFDKENEDIIEMSNHYNVE
jgi:hypothetical protein